MDWIDALLDLAYPRLCLSCQRKLSLREKFCCASCLAELPRLHMADFQDNRLEQLFRGQVPVERAVSFLRYTTDNPACRFFHRLKYGHDPQAGIFFGSLFARELQLQGFFEGIDLLVPVPLSGQRLRTRGYNQAEMIARGIAQVTRLPVDTHSLQRIKDNSTQTHLDRNARWSNAQSLFVLRDTPPSRYRHFLLVDDIVTTGATLCACACALHTIPGTRISLLTLGATNW